MNPLQIYVHMFLATALIIFFLQALNDGEIILDEGNSIVLFLGSIFWPITWLWFILCAVLMAAVYVTELWHTYRTRG